MRLLVVEVELVLLVLVVDVVEAEIEFISYSGLRGCESKNVALLVDVVVVDVVLVVDVDAIADGVL